MLTWWTLQLLKDLRYVRPCDAWTPQVRRRAHVRSVRMSSR